MLHELEVVCNALEGLRVSFCKSGKDRTGMAVTLEQARFLGERCLYFIYWFSYETFTYMLDTANIVAILNLGLDVVGMMRNWLIM